MGRIRLRLSLVGGDYKFQKIRNVEIITEYLLNVAGYPINCSPCLNFLIRSWTMEQSQRFGSSHSEYCHELWGTFYW